MVHTSQVSGNKKAPVSLHSKSKSSVSLGRKSLSHGKLNKLGENRDKKEDSFTATEEDEMAASFPNYCTMCDKQIHHPELSILYCSKACRNQDTNKSPISKPPSPLISPFSTVSMEGQPRDLVPQHSPTTPATNRFSYSEASSSDNDYSSDEYRPSLIRQDSDAARYLAQFQSQSAIDQPSSRSSRRPAYHRSHASSSAAPSLSHTPASSISASIPYTPSTRPLPPRNNPWGSYGAKSIQLVQPFTPMTQEPAPLTALSTSDKPSYSFKARPSTGALSMGVAEGELHRYEKVTMVSVSAGMGQSSLKSLLDSSKMQPPASRRSDSGHSFSSDGSGSTARG